MLGARLGLGLTPPHRVTGVPFYGLDFGGDDYVDCGATAWGTTDLTIECWLNWTAPGAAYIGPWMITAWNHPTGGGMYRLSTNDKVRVQLGNAQALETLSFPYYGAWHHFALTYRSLDADAWLWVDGAANRHESGGAAGINFSGTLYLGRLSSSHYFTGSIAFFRVWSTVRSQAEIQAEMYNPWLRHPDILVSYVMTPGTGQTLTDYSGNGQTGQLGSTGGADTNDPTWAGPYTGLTAGGPA